jgi:predicted RNA-binding Zn-ribbon protein involved in translation (DUF1610 family)
MSEQGFKDLIRDAIYKTTCPHCGTPANTENVLRIQRGKPNIVEYACPGCKKIYPKTVSDLP